MTQGRGLFRRRVITMAMATTVALALLPSHAAQATIAGGRSTIVWSDLDKSIRWARSAINYVGATNDWMRDFAPNPDGTYPFQPTTIETRKYFARAVVMAFAPTETLDPSITIADLDPGDAFYPAANIAVKLHWMTKAAAGTFAPDKAVTMTMVHRVLTVALGLAPAIKSLNHLHTSDGVTFDLPPNFGALVLGMRLGLRYNNSDESQDVGPNSPLSRAQVAYSLFRAATQPSWNVPELIAQYQDISLPSLTPDQQAIVQWGVRYAGFPYVYGGEWGIPTSSYDQAVPGFDCSGFTWWLLRASDGAYWNVSPPRPYLGWDLPQRTSADMATVGKLSYDQLRPGDLMFYDGDGDGSVDHVDTFIGNGWALDSSSTPGGVTVMWVGDGWYRDHFVHGRRVLPDQPT